MLWDFINGLSEAMQDILKQLIYPFDILFKPTKIENQRKKDSLNEKIVTLVESLEKSQEIVFEITEDIKLKQVSLNTLNAQVNELEAVSNLKNDEVSLILKQIEIFDKKTSKKKAINSIVVNVIFLILGCVIQYFISKYLL